jgi:hypothetical protein
MWGSVVKFLAGSVVEFITNYPDFLASDQANSLPLSLVMVWLGPLVGAAAVLMGWVGFMRKRV